VKTTLLLLIMATGLTVALASDAPDEVTIDGLSHWFEAVEFSHGYHAEMADCTDCHHYQDAEDAGSCSDCHGVDYDPSDPDTPDLKLAYHLTCMGCHQQDGGPLACVDCHARAALPEGVELKEGRLKDR
jgi:cytochrome c553